MKATTKKYLSWLAQTHGSYSDLARRLGITPRTFRQRRNGTMSPLVAKLTAFAGQALFLRLVIRELRAGGVSTDAIRQAVQRALHSVSSTR